jgi:hypothetical protein
MAVLVARLLALLRTDKLSLFLRPRATNHASRYLDRESVSRLHVRGGNLGTAGALGRGLSFHRRRIVPDRHNRLHVQQRELIVAARAVAIPRLGAILACLSRLGVRIRPARITGVGHSRLGSAAGVLLLHAAPKSASRSDARQHQLRLGSERSRSSELGFARRLAHRVDDRIALAAVRADSFSATAHRPEAGAVIVPYSRPASSFRRRQLRASLAKFAAMRRASSLGMGQ